MYCRHKSGSELSYYYCSSKQRRLHVCEQKSVQVERIEAQVLTALRNLKPSPDWRKGVAQAVSEAIGEQDLEARLEQIRGTIERMDFRWDNGFIMDKDDYLEKRLKLQQELERITPSYDDLDRAVDMLNNFDQFWNECEGDIERQRRLLSLILERVYVDGQNVKAITLKSDYHFVLGHNANEPTYTEVDPKDYVWAQRDLNS